MGNGQSEQAADPPDAKTSVSFMLNGKHSVVKDASPLLSLNDWLQIQPGYGGTKSMCGEGGCGCCVVTADIISPEALPLCDGLWELVNSQNSTIAINSCLCPLYAIDGWHITTIEGLGSSAEGFHPIQLRLADYNGTQCGYCTPGFVMSMYSLLQSNPHPTQQQVEDNFDGNICRCTGYRPILDAMKSFASDSKLQLDDIEDLDTGVCPKTGKVCHGDHFLCKGHMKTSSDPSWYAPTSLAEMKALFNAKPDSKFRCVAGDTGRGVYKDLPEVDMLVSLANVSELRKVQVSKNSLIIGASISLANFITLLQNNADKSSNFLPLAKHLLQVANVPVRNSGTWAGNIMLAHAHQDFPSDIFLLLAASRAILTIESLHTLVTTSCSLWELLTLDMSMSLILSVEIPFFPSTVTFKSYKIMPRAENAVAYVNAAFAMEIENFTVGRDPIIVIGGGNARPIACPMTAKFIVNKSLLDSNTLKGVMEVLTEELSSVDVYKKNVALGLLYKFYVGAIPGHTRPSVQSASSMLVRPLSHGSQSFTPQPSEYPVGVPIHKLAARLQASGEAEYTTDLPLLPNEIAAAFVLTTKSNVVILQIDTSVAEQMPGFIKVITAKDIPPGGTNNFVSPHVTYLPEQLFADYKSEYTGQAAALVLADTPQNARKIAKTVTFEYGEADGPVIVEIKDAVKEKLFYDEGLSTMSSGNANAAIANSDMSLEGEIECGSQYHFTMETQTAMVVPKEDGYIVYSSTQCVTGVQSAVANVLGIPNSNVDAVVKRVGGGYGSKITRANLIAAACGLGAYATRRPVRMHMDLETNMKLIGKRYPYYATYKVGFSKEGIVNGISVNMYGNAGITPNGNSNDLITGYIDNAYHVANWDLTLQLCRSNIASNTACRSPGTVPAIFVVESIMDHVARTLDMDVEIVKKMNLYKQGDITPGGTELKYCNIISLWEQLYQSADVANRKAKIAVFNKNNRWIKHGISMVPLKFRVDLSGGISYTVLVNIYAEDGTVAVAHGGVEIGQGINTKVTQVAAMTLGIPMERIRIKPCSTMTNPNSVTTGGSTTSEFNCLGTIKACQMLNDRIQPIRDKYPDLSWSDLIAKCYDESIDLSAKFCVTNGGDGGNFYYTYGVTVTEVELDVLTGLIQIPRVDILYDCGNSMNPEIDVGQVEGAFVMGLGYWLTERLTYDKTTGELSSHNTWTYKPPSSKDIPIDLRVELLKNAPNPRGILGSKACGEPPFCMSCSALFAVKRSIEEARKDIGNKDFFALSGPATIEDIRNACLVDSTDFIL